MNDWPGRIEQNIFRRELFRRNESILVAVSGGLDSMVLFDLLHALSKSHGWKIIVAHFNHQLRGRSSDADERLVQKTAANAGCKLIVDRANVKKFAQTNRLSIEMAARKLRHEFLARTAKSLKIKTIAVAHHADDQVELFFLRLLRGAGAEGLSGMSWKSNSPADSSVQLVRPLLDQPKEFLRDYATSRKIKFREDASNASLDFRRNRIRHEIVPLLKSIQPAVNETVLRAQEILAEESDFISATAKAWLKNRKREPFDQLHVAVQRVALRLQLRPLGVAAEFALIERLREQANRPITVNRQLSLLRDSTGTVRPCDQKTVSFQEDELRIDLLEESETIFGGKRIAWKVVKRKGAAFSSKPNCEWFDADKVGLRVWLRHWKRGDRFWPIGARSTKKLQDLFTDLKIPRSERHKRVVALTERGEIFWVEGLRMAECFKLDKASVRRLKWQWQDP